mgnify:CR=1 FL=1
MVRAKYYTPSEVAVHNTLEDLWVSFLGKVYDLTPLINKPEHKGKPHDHCYSIYLLYLRLLEIKALV